MENISLSSIKDKLVLIYLYSPANEKVTPIVKVFCDTKALNKKTRSELTKQVFFVRVI